MRPHPCHAAAAGSSLAAAGAGSGGFNRFGRLDSLLYQPAGIGFRAAWTATPLDRDLEALAVFLFADGAYFHSAPASRGFLDFLPPPDRDEFDVVAYILPNSPTFQTWPALDFHPENRVRFSWTYAAGRVSKVIIRLAAGATVGTPPPAETFLHPLPTLADPVALSGGSLSVSGIFTGPEPSGTFTVTVTESGTPGDDTAAAEFEFSDGVDTLATGSFLIPAGRFHLADGVFLEFEEETAYTAGDEWEITLEWPESFTSEPLTPGTYAGRVDTYNARGQATSSNAPTVTLTGPPNPPTPVSVAHTSGETSAELVYSVPSTGAAAALALAYLNFSAVAVASAAATPGSNVTLTLPGLRPGSNHYLVRLMTAAGEIEQNEEWQELTLSDDLATSGPAPTPPLSLTASESAGGAVAVSILAGDDSDEIRIYSDAGTGTVDYSTPIHTVTNTAAAALNRLSDSFAWTLGAGRFILAARAAADDIEESNTDILADLFVELAAAPAATLSLEAVS